jgi:hypothetical protein
MKLITSDEQTIDFDASQSRVLSDMFEDGCEGAPRIPFRSDTLNRLQTGTLDESWETLADMIRAADFLDMPEMLDRLGQRMAEMLKGRPATQVREMMAILS